MTYKIQKLGALEILDSRGRPTVRAACTLEGGISAAASAPSGASTGAAEALELRDGDMSRYGGLGCRNAVANVNRDIHNAFAGQAFASQAELDAALCALDGTSNKSRLGANAILAVSLAVARAAAQASGVPLYAYFASLIGQPARTLPRPTINLFSGGKHAGVRASMQDILIVPAAARSMDEAMAVTYGVYQAAAELVLRKYGMRMLRADEGGLAPPFPAPEAMLSDAVEAIIDAGFTPGREVMLAVDVASSHFFDGARYQLGAATLDSAGMIDTLARWSERYPIVSIEDGLHEDDWAAWPVLRQRMHGRALTLGDDFLCTNPARIVRAIEAKACDALLLKVNQIGTLSEAATACRLAREAGWRVTVSARSGETEDDWLADLAVAWGDQIKVGSITQSERLAKYNRLLLIEAETRMPLVGWPTA